MQTVWFNDDNYKSLGDVYKRFGFLDYNNESVINMIDQECASFLSTKLKNYNRDIQHFEYDFDASDSGDMLVFKPDNIMCALWFVGVFPADVDKVLEKNRFENSKYVYTFDKKSCKLKRKIRKLKK